MATINVPVIKQNELGKDPAFQVSACAACCIVAVARTLGYSGASIDDAIGDGYVDGTTAKVLNWSYHFAATVHEDVTEQQCFAAVVSQILAGKPMIIKLAKPNTTHYVVAYGFVGEGDRADRIYVMDPIYGNGSLSTTYNIYDYAFDGCYITY